MQRRRWQGERSPARPLAQPAARVLRALPCSPVPSLSPYRAQVKEGYFGGLVAAGRVKEEVLGEHIFASKPASGGAVLTLKL